MCNYFFQFKYGLRCTIKEVLSKKVYTIFIVSFLYILGIILGGFIKINDKILEYYNSNAIYTFFSVIIRDSKITRSFFSRFTSIIIFFIVVLFLSIPPKTTFLFSILSLYRGYLLSICVKSFILTLGLSGILFSVFIIILQNVLSSILSILFFAYSRMVLKIKFKNRLIVILKAFLLIVACAAVLSLIELFFTCFLFRALNFNY